MYVIIKCNIMCVLILYCMGTYKHTATLLYYPHTYVHVRIVQVSFKQPFKEAGRTLNINH